jgi:FAD/FMN-containing dehydrogenase
MVLLSRLSQCQFAVKSGGHSAFAGAATIEGGITVSFENMKGIKLSGDKKTVAVQPGNNWGNVLTALSSTGVTVVAGRIGDLGVGGLTLGGGISFITNEYGLACDNVASFDVSCATEHVTSTSLTPTRSSRQAASSSQQARSPFPISTGLFAAEATTSAS